MRLTNLSIGSLLVISAVSQPLIAPNGHTYLPADYCSHPRQGEGCNPYTQNPCCTSGDHVAKCQYDWKKVTNTWEITQCQASGHCSDTTCYRWSDSYSSCMC